MKRNFPRRQLGWLCIGLLLLPALNTLWISFSPDSFLTPPVGTWSLRWYRQFLGDSRWMWAAGRSLVVATLAAGASVAVATPAALAGRGESSTWSRFLQGCGLLPLFIPPAALGAGLLPVFHRAGLWGTWTGLVLAHTALGAPVALLIIGSQLSPGLEELEQAARGLGAGRWQVWWRVTFPLLRPVLAAGAIAVFILSLNESLVTLFLATPTNETLPAVVWPQLRFSPSPLVAVAAVATSLLGTLGLWLLLTTLERPTVAADRE